MIKSHFPHKHRIDKLLAVIALLGHAGSASYHASQLVGPDKRQAAQAIRSRNADMELQGRVWNTGQTTKVRFV